MTLAATCANSAPSYLPPRSTGKERDTESGNDYCSARYYNSATGRFLSPDWDAKSSDPVPYAKLDDPQSLTSTATSGITPSVGPTQMAIHISFMTEIVIPSLCTAPRAMRLGNGTSTTT